MKISDALAKQLLNTAPDPTVIVDSDGTIVFATARVQDLLGYTPSEILGRPVECLLPENVRATHPGLRDNFFTAPRARSMGASRELFALCKNGSQIPVEVSLSPLETPDGILVTSAIRDLSDQKALSQELQRANRAKTRFLAAASHDLRQPIQALNLLNQAAKRKTTDPVHQEIISKQQKSLDRLSHLLGSLLDISKLEAGVIKPDIVDTSVKDIFDILQATFEAQADHKGLTLDIEPAEHQIKSDPKLLTQILENFVSNAIRYTRQGAVRIHTALCGDSVRLMVTDTGIGIPADQIESIFDEFHQTQQSSSNEGLGLGLSIVQRTAELLECGVGVESKEGQGSSFHIDVPQGDQETASASPLDNSTTRAAASGHILIVDDESDIVEATTMLLEMEGFTVSSASSIPTLRGLIMGGHEPPDLLISDFHLKHGETGLEVIELTRQSFGASIPVILLSGDTQNQLLLGNQKDVTFFTKPVDVGQLLDTAVKLMNRPEQ